MRNPTNLLHYTKTELNSKAVKQSTNQGLEVLPLCQTFFFEMDHDTQRWVVRAKKDITTIDKKPLRYFWSDVAEFCTVRLDPEDEWDFPLQFIKTEYRYEVPENKSTHLGCPDQNCPCPKKF